MHIALTGNLGSGKSTISRIMNEKYGYEIYSTGKIIRQLAEERGITVLEMNQLMQTDHSFDTILDDTTHRISIERKQDIFFDSRLAWHFAENCFKVFLSVSLDEAARRVYNDARGDVETYSSQEDARAQLLERAKTEDVRYKEIYDIEYFKTSNYNLVLDSTFSSPELLAATIMEEKARYEQLAAEGKTPAVPRILLAPSRLCKRAHGNNVDNNLIYEGGIKVHTSMESIDVLEGMDEVQLAADKGYEFVAVTDI